MATQEERLSGLEFDLKGFRSETIHAYGEMAYELVVVKGLGEDSIKRLAALQREINARFDTITDELSAHTLLLHQILDRLPPKE